MLATHPAGDLRIGLGALLERVPADQLDLVKEDHPPGRAGRHEQLRGEPEPLQTQLPGGYRRQRRPGLTDFLEASAKLRRGDRVTGPEPHDRVREGRVAVA